MGENGSHETTMNNHGNPWKWALIRALFILEFVAIIGFDIYARVNA